jgi:hypothetical protein
MKMMKWALLGGAAFAVMSTSAQADELTALKAQLEALQARVTQLEAQPATSMPSGYSLLSMRDGSQAAPVAESRKDYIDPNSGVTFSVLPSADVAPAAEVSVSAEIRTLLVYDDQGFPGHLTRVHRDKQGNIVDVNVSGDNDSHLDVQVRGRLVAQGKVDTAVGEVGARVRLQGGNPFDTGTNNQTLMNQAYGWWKFAPNWQLIAGYWDTTAAVQAGVDRDFTVGTTGGPSDKNVEQMRLVFGGDGPFSLAIALEDTDSAFTTRGVKVVTSDGDILFRDASFTADAPDRGRFPDVAGYLMFNQDKLMLQAVGVYQDDQFGKENDWGVGAGARIGLGDMFTLTAAGVFARGYNGWANDFTIGEDDEFWAASGGLIFNIAEATRLEAGVGYENLNADDKHLETSLQPFDRQVWVVNGGIYWDPVSQATVGLQANWISNDKDTQTGAGRDRKNISDNDTDFQVRFGTWLRFP